MDLALIFFTAWMVGFSGAMMPGPLLTVTIGESVKRGAKAGPLLMIGHSLLELFLVVALVLGLRSLFQNILFEVAVSIIGGVFLLWMGYGMVKDSMNGTISLDLSIRDRKTLLGPVMTGALVSLSNPYWTVWWATLGLSYITEAWKYGFIGLVFFYFGHIMADFAWYGAVSLAVAKGRRLMTDKTYRGIMAFCGAFLFLLAVTFIWNGVTKV